MYAPRIQKIFFHFVGAAINQTLHKSNFNMSGGSGNRSIIR